MIGNYYVEVYTRRIQAKTKVNNMRASKNLKILEVDAVAEAEDNKGITIKGRLTLTNGVCVVGMYENVQLRNLGDPDFSMSNGRLIRNGAQALVEENLEVGLFHSTVEAR